MRIAARPPRILIDRKLLTEESLAAIEKERGITLPEAVNLYLELRGLGDMKDFDKDQKRFPANGARWQKENTSNARLATTFWPEMLGDGAVDEIEVDAVNDALTHLLKVPANHGRSPKDRGRYQFIEMADAKDRKIPLRRHILTSDTGMGRNLRNGRLG